MRRLLRHIRRVFRLMRIVFAAVEVFSAVLGALP